MFRHQLIRSTNLHALELEGIGPPPRLVRLTNAHHDPELPEELDVHPQLLRSTNGLENDLRYDALWAVNNNCVEVDMHRKGIAFSAIFLHTTPCLNAFNLLKKAFAKLKS